MSGKEENLVRICRLVNLQAKEILVWFFINSLLTTPLHRRFLRRRLLAERADLTELDTVIGATLGDLSVSELQEIREELVQIHVFIDVDFYGLLEVGKIGAIHAQQLKAILVILRMFPERKRSLETFTEIDRAEIVGIDGKINHIILGARLEDAKKSELGFGVVQRTPFIGLGQVFSAGNLVFADGAEVNGMDQERGIFRDDFIHRLIQFQQERLQIVEIRNNDQIPSLLERGKERRSELQSKLVGVIRRLDEAGEHIDELTKGFVNDFANIRGKIGRMARQDGLGILSSAGKDERNEKHASGRHC